MCHLSMKVTVGKWDAHYTPPGWLTKVQAQEDVVGLQFGIVRACDGPRLEHFQTESAVAASAFKLCASLSKEESQGQGPGGPEALKVEAGERAGRPAAKTGGQMQLVSAMKKAPKKEETKDAEGGPAAASPQAVQPVQGLDVNTCAAPAPESQAPEGQAAHVSTQAAPPNHPASTVPEVGLSST